MAGLEFVNVLGGESPTKKQVIIGQVWGFKLFFSCWWFDPLGASKPFGPLLSGATDTLYKVAHRDGAADEDLEGLKV